MNLRSTSKQDGRPEELWHSELSTTAESHVPYFRTTSAERFLLFATVLILPLEEHIPSVAGFSIMFFIFTVLAAYVAINRLQCLDRVWMHPVFVAAYLFIGISAVLEFVSPSSSYVEIASFAMMVVGALLVATLCRDRAALKVFLYGYIGASLWLGALLFLTTYGALSGASATGSFHEASKVRSQAFAEMPIQANLNRMAFICTQGAVVAVAFALGSASVRARSYFAAIGIFCLVASTLPMSRGALINILVSCGAILKANGIKHVRVWLLVAVTAISAVLLAPDAVWTRMMFTMQSEDKMEKRGSMYVSAWEYVDEYLFMGVGAGNYFNTWGFDHGFGSLSIENKLYVVHNAFLQVLIFWGLISFIVFLAIIWLAYRCLPRTYGNDVLKLGMLGIAVSLLMLMPFSSGFYHKAFSLGLGMLVAYQRWLAPSSAAQLANR